MKKPCFWFLRIVGTVGALGLLGTLVVALVSPTTASAQDVEPPLPFDPGFIFDIDNPDFESGINVIYYPWVANDDESTGLGPADTSITVQNLSLALSGLYRTTVASNWQAGGINWRLPGLVLVALLVLLWHSVRRYEHRRWAITPSASPIRDFSSVSTYHRSRAEWFVWPNAGARGAVVYRG